MSACIWYPLLGVNMVKTCIQDEIVHVLGGAQTRNIRLIILINHLWVLLIIWMVFRLGLNEAIELSLIDWDLIFGDDHKHFQ